MNPILIFLIFLATFLIWVLGAFLFRPIGSVVKKLMDDVKDSISEDETKEENKESK